MLHKNILGTIGRTPVVRLNRIAPEHVNLYVKLEAFNPMGSVKDRLAFGVIERAEREGALRPGQTVIEATSGNTGIGLAMVCAAKGYPLVVTMAENFSVERRRLMRFLGARVVLTPAAQKGSGIAQSRGADGSPAESHPAFRPHVVQGWGPDFIPKLAEDVVRQGFIDRVVAVNGAESLRLARRLATEEGILAGISGGATLAGALEVCRGLPEGANVLCMIPDTGERYLSTPLFEDVPAEMTEEEIELSRSTPGYRFDAPATSPAPAETPSVPENVDPAAAAFVADAIRDPREPVVLFALEWCEFCWSLRRLFARLGIPFRSIDLDSVDFQRDDLGGRIRTALAASNGVTTIPQLFVGGEFVRGCTDTHDAWRNGRLQAMLETAGTEFDRSAEVDPYAFLPRWLQSR